MGFVTPDTVETSLPIIAVPANPLSGPYTSLSLSADGLVMAIGVRNIDPGTGVESGGVFAYDLSGGVWIQRGGAIFSVDPAWGASSSDNFGASVSISADGNAVAVNSFVYVDAIGVGHSQYVFDWTGSAWVQRGGQIYTTNIDLVSSSGSSLSSGRSTISISDDKNTIAVASGDAWFSGPGTVGAVLLYDWNGSAWVQRADVVINAPQVSNKLFAWGAHLSGDKQKLTVLGQQSTVGWTIYSFVLSGGVFVYDGTPYLIPGTDNLSVFADLASSVSDDHTVAFIGNNGTAKDIYRMERSGGSWSMALDADLSGRSADFSMAASSDLSTLAIYDYTASAPTVLVYSNGVVISLPALFWTAFSGQREI